MTEHTPEVEFSEQDEKDLSTLLGEAAEAKYNPVLRIWKEVLSDDNLDHGARVTIPWSNAVIGKYNGMSFALMPAFVERYIEIMRSLADELREEIASDDDCLDWHTVDEDIEENGGHYRALLTTWQKKILLWETAWDCTHADAAAHVAALGEASAFFFGENGLTGHLSTIGFEFTEADQAALAEALMEYQAELAGGVSGE